MEPVPRGRTAGLMTNGHITAAPLAPVICWRHTLAKFIPAHRAAWARTRLGSVALVARARFQQITSCRPGSILPFFVDGRMDQIHTNIHKNSHIQIYIQKVLVFLARLQVPNDAVNVCKRCKRRLRTKRGTLRLGPQTFGAT